MDCRQVGAKPLSEPMLDGTLLIKHQGTNCGTLVHAKNKYAHRNVKKDVKDCMNHAVELLDVLTDGYVVGVALAHIDVPDAGQEPAQLPKDGAELQAYKESVVDSVMNVAFHPLT